MSRPEVDEAMTAESFKDQLTSLVETATDHGLEIERNWLCRTGDDGPDYEAEFVRLQD